jgi:signal transduction histidine kinase
LDAPLEAATSAAATAAFADHSQPIVKQFFVFENGILVAPALHAGPPRETPAAFLEAEQQELELGRLSEALTSYRRLLGDRSTEPLSLSRVARVQSKLGKETDAQATWRELARKYPDERDLSGRPFGVVAAINAGDTAGLAEKIMSGRWDLSGDQATFFLSKLGRSDDASSYLAQFRWAQQLTDQFKPPAALGDGDVERAAFGQDRIIYKSDRPGRIIGFLVNPDWVSTERSRLSQELGIENTRRADTLLYAGAFAVILLVLSGGVVFLWRDLSRETRLNLLRADFVSSVSHELKTPITLVRLYGETLLRHGTLTASERREFYRIITRESARLGRLVEQVLTFARVEKGAQDYDLKEGDVAPVIAGVIDDYSEWLEDAGFTLTRSIPAETPPIRFDQAAISQALVNLLDNAAKYSGAGRDITIRVDAADAQVRVEVEDHGIGIAPEDQQRIFERFQRAANHTGKGGYGLGLFMVRHIMTAHGGHAEVESVPGYGSTFRLVFPVAS